ncbi:MAG TPA: AraC family transcriptional regulator [Candidatus Saccharimonadales bacterium]|nr:AraC family transcriptional regulator [Candidatus Saccharimonadales bacterium]
MKQIILLHTFNTQRFRLQSSSIAFPSFDNVETFAENMARLGLLNRDIVVEDALKVRKSSMSTRTVQRHFLATTGLTLNYIRQIRRAEKARAILATHYSLSTIAYEVGYSNPGHMTNAFKHLFGQTPTQLRARMSGEF